MAAKKSSARTKANAKGKKKATKGAGARPKRIAPKQPSLRPSATGAPASTAELLGDLPRLSDAERAAFRQQFTDEQCVELGDRTKSAAVREEALRWALVMSATLRDHPLAVRRYRATRLAWFVECLRTLEKAIDEQESARDDERQTGLGIDIARIAVFAVHNDLRDTLSILAGADTREKSAIADALATRHAAGDDASLATSLRALAEVAERWLARADEGAKTLVASVSLSRADVDAARTAADELDRALALDASPGGLMRDAPTVDLHEGRVLAEMRLAMGVFARAHESNRAVPELLPGPGTRAVLVVPGSRTARATKGASSNE